MLLNVLLLIIFTITIVLIRSVNDIPVILLVLFLVLSLLLALACALRRFSHQQKEKAKKKRGGEGERRADRMRPQVIHSVINHFLRQNIYPHLIARLLQDLIILASALPPPPPYTEEVPEAPPTVPTGKSFMLTVLSADKGRIRSSASVSPHPN